MPVAPEPARGILSHSPVAVLACSASQPSQASTDSKQSTGSWSEGMKAVNHDAHRPQA